MEKSAASDACFPSWEQEQGRAQWAHFSTGNKEYCVAIELSLTEFPGISAVCYLRESIASVLLLPLWVLSKEQKYEEHSHLNLGLQLQATSGFWSTAHLLTWHSYQGSAEHKPSVSKVHTILADCKQSLSAAANPVLQLHTAPGAGIRALTQSLVCKLIWTVFNCRVYLISVITTPALDASNPPKSNHEGINSGILPRTK